MNCVCEVCMCGVCEYVRVKLCKCGVVHVWRVSVF